MISVTQALTITGAIETEWFTPESALRGQIVHELTETFDCGELVFVPPGLEGYLQAYAEFVSVVQPVYHFSELEVVRASWRLGGRIDRVCELFGEPGILDFKTGAAASWHGQQLAAYNALYPTGSRWCLYLSANGKWKLKTYDDPMDHHKFMGALAKALDRVDALGDYWIPRAA